MGIVERWNNGTVEWVSGLSGMGIMEWWNIVEWCNGYLVEWE